MAQKIYDCNCQCPSCDHAHGTIKKANCVSPGPRRVPNHGLSAQASPNNPVYSRPQPSIEKNSSNPEVKGGKPWPDVKLRRKIKKKISQPSFREWLNHLCDVDSTALYHLHDVYEHEMKKESND